MSDPRELEDETEIDRDDDRLDDEEVPYDKLMAMLKGDDDPADDVAFGEGDEPAAKESDVVSIEDGLDLLDKAAQGKREASKVDPAPEDDATPAEAKRGDEAKAEDAPEDGTAEGDKPDTPEQDADDLDAILADVPEARREAIRSRVTAADEIMSIFKGREAELEQHGVKPADAVKRLVEINAYATSNPSDYIAWAASKLGQDPAEVLGKAAERLGMKLVAAASDGEEDPFEDPAIKEMRQRLAAYEAREKMPDLGPDAPQFRTQTELQRFASEQPHWQSVAPQIAAMAGAHVQTTGRPVSIADIERFYRASVYAAGLEQPQTTPAAQVQQPVAQQAQKTSAAQSDSVERARRASKSLDGSGQGAGRRPALDPDASLESVVGSIYRDMMKG